MYSDGHYLLQISLPFHHVFTVHDQGRLISAELERWWQAGLKMMIHALIYLCTILQLVPALFLKLLSSLHYYTYFLETAFLTGNSHIPHQKEEMAPYTPYISSKSIAPIIFSYAQLATKYIVWIQQLVSTSAICMNDFHYQRISTTKMLWTKINWPQRRTLKSLHEDYIISTAAVWQKFNVSSNNKNIKHVALPIVKLHLTEKNFDDYFGTFFLANTPISLSGKLRLIFG